MNDFLDFDSLLVQAERLDKKGLREWNRGVHERLAQSVKDPLDALLDECLAPQAMWIADANVVLIREMSCSTCNTTEARCEGWFTVQRHRNDKHARRLVVGKSQSPLPVRVERHQVPALDICSACAESQVMIEELSHYVQG